MTPSSIFLTYFQHVVIMTMAKAIMRMMMMMTAMVITMMMMTATDDDDGGNDDDDYDIDVDGVDGIWDFGSFSTMSGDLELPPVEITLWKTSLAPIAASG